MTGSLLVVAAVTIIVVVIITFIFILTRGHKHYVKYLHIISDIGIVIVFISFIYDYIESNKAEKNKYVNMFIQTTTDGWNNIEKMFLDYYPYLERLYYQMYPSIPDIQVPKVDENERHVQEQHASHIILRAIQEVFIANGGLKTNWPKDQQSWLYSFKQWMSSSILREYWYAHEREYPSDMRVFMNTIVMTPPSPSHH
jgi:hypothetical protein